MTDRSDEMRRLLLAALPGLAHAAEDDLATDELGRDQDAVARAVRARSPVSAKK